jgi:hypothetical protein
MRGRANRGLICMITVVVAVQALACIYLFGLPFWQDRPERGLTQHHATRTKLQPPARPPSPPPPPASPEPLDYELELRATFLHLVNELQNPPNCRTAPLYVYVPTAYTSGLGSQVRMMAHSMLRAILLGRTFVADAATSAYVHPARCPDRSYDCLFLPLSKCTLADAMADLPPNATAERLAAAETKHWFERPPATEGDLSSTTKQADPKLREYRHRLGELRREDLPAGPDQPRVVSGRVSCLQLDAQDSERLFKVVDGHLVKEAAHAALLELAKRDAAASVRSPGGDEVLRPEGTQPPSPPPSPEMATFMATGTSEDDEARQSRLASPPRAVPASSWWVQQLTGGYIARPTPRVLKFADELSAQLKLMGDAGLRDGKGTLQFPSVGYLGMHLRRGDKLSEAKVHETAVYARYAADLHVSTGKSTLLLASDDPEPYESLPRDLPELRIKWVPFDRLYVNPQKARLVAAKTIEALHKDAGVRGPQLSDRMQRRAQLEGDEGEVQLAQLVLLSRATALVGTLTSNYLLLAYEMAVDVRAREGQPPPAVLDLDGNTYFPCSVRDRPPWGPRHGKAGMPYSRLAQATITYKGAVHERRTERTEAKEPLQGGNYAE